MKKRNKKKLLIVDNNNLFIRNYNSNPSLSNNGEHIGGLKGSLSSLQKICREVKPDRIVVVFDGPSGSKRRRSIYNDYKSGRKPIRLNRFIKNYSEEEEFENRIWQLTTLSEYYDLMPIYQFIIDSVEADDVISYVAQLEDFKDYLKIIYSSDKDFVQLISTDTILYRPLQGGEREILNVPRVVEKFKIHPNNFVIARSIVGDDSDNLKGIQRAGIPTIAKRFPFLSEDKQHYLTDIYEHSQIQILNETKIKLYQSILEGKEKIEQNYKLMQLTVPEISYQDKQKIRKEIKEKKLIFNKTEIQKKMVFDSLMDYNWDSLFLTLRMIADNK